MTRPKRPLKDELAEATATLRAIAEGSVAMDKAGLSRCLIAYQRGQEATKNRRCKPDDPVHGQLAEIDAILAGNAGLRGQWESWRGNRDTITRFRHGGLPAFKIGIPAPPNLEKNSEDVET